MMFYILVFHIPGAGHPTEFTISYTGDKKALNAFNAKRAFGTYTYIGMIKGGSPVYHYELRDDKAHSNFYFARQYLGAENDKIWKLKVMTMGFIIFGRIVYTLRGCLYLYLMVNMRFLHFRLTFKKMNSLIS